MEMHQFRYFLALCETLNFTRAAEQCNVSQPSLTRAIKKLEDELGGPLFRRERKLTHLTDLGRLMRPQFQKLIDASEQARNDAEDYYSLEQATLTLGVMCTIGPARLIGLIDRLQNDIPKLELKLRDAPGHKLVDELISGDVDLAIIGLPDYPERLDARMLYSERFVVAFPTGHRFEAMNSVPLRELADEDYLSRTNCEHGDYLDAIGRPAEFEVNLRHQSEHESWIQALVLAGMGCAVMPEFLPMLPGIATRVVTEPETRREVKLVTVSGRQYSPPVEAFIRLACQHEWAANV